MGKHADILYRLARFLTGVPPDTLGATFLFALENPEVMAALGTIVHFLLKFVVVVVVFALQYVVELIISAFLTWYGVKMFAIHVWPKFPRRLRQLLRRAEERIFFKPTSSQTGVVEGPTGDRAGRRLAHAGRLKRRSRWSTRVYPASCTLRDMGEQNRLSVPDAARVLGTTEGALRKRIARGTLPYEKDDQGRVWVRLDTQADTSTQRGPTGETVGHPTGQDRTQELIEELRNRVRSLEEANRENRRIIAALTSRIPELEAPSEPQNQPETATGATPRSTTPPKEPQEPVSRPWWRRWIGG